MNILFNIDKANDVLKIPKDYNPDEWIVVTSYYAMYMAALVLIAKIGLKSKNHSATITAIEEYFVKKNHLTKKIYH